MNRIVIFGGNSAIAEALARLYAQDGARCVLIGRSAERLGAVAADLRVRGAAEAHVLIADLSDCARHAPLIAEATQLMGGIDACIIAHGTLSDQAACETDAGLAIDAISLNFLSAVSILTHVANALLAQGSGAIAVIGSVAGDRGRRSNYVYGSAKAGLGAFVEGLRHRLGPQGIGVTLVKPGFVDTPMTASIAKKGLLWATPERVAKDIRRGIRANAAVVYTPWFWRWIMLIIRNIPDAIFRRMSI